MHSLVFLKQREKKEYVEKTAARSEATRKVNLSDATPVASSSPATATERSKQRKTQTKKKTETPPDGEGNRGKKARME